MISMVSLLCWHVLKLITVPLETDLPELASHRPIIHNSSSAALDLAQAWYTRCLTHHDTCHRVWPHDYQGPSRLIDLSLADQSSWRLCEISGDAIQRVDYFTLSHCWGKVPLFNLNSSTVEAMKLGMPLSRLPRTFQDAIHIARKLGADYMWIDSLCIMQDSLEDWQQVSARMRDIYAYSACNIAATAAVDSTQGCLFERAEQSTDELFKVRAGPWAGSREYVILDLHWLAGQVRDAVLSQRAWVVQERVLSPRTLHMGRDQIFWECERGLACEFWPDAIPKAFEDAFGLMFRNVEEKLHETKVASSTEGVSGTLPTSKHQHPAPTYVLWGLVMEHYSQCKLTKSHDKLVAISGIAKLFQASLPGDVYLAGLWKNDLAYGLLWRSATYQPSALVRVPDRAPSWSWASVDGKLLAAGRELVMRNEAILVKIVDAQTRLRTADPTGQVLDGRVALTGMLFETNFTERNPGRITPAGTLIPKPPSAAAQNIGAFVYPDTDLRRTFSQRTFFFLPVHELIWRQTHLINGLMLTPVDDTRTEFSRIGFVSITVSNVEKHSRVFGVVVEPFGKVGLVDSTVQQQTISIV